MGKCSFGNSVIDASIACIVNTFIRAIKDNHEYMVQQIYNEFKSKQHFYIFLSPGNVTTNIVPQNATAHKRGTQIASISYFG